MCKTKHLREQIWIFAKHIALYIKQFFVAMFYGMDLDDQPLLNVN